MSRYLTMMPTRTPTSSATGRRHIASIAIAAVTLLGVATEPAPAAAAVPHFDGLSADGGMVFFTTTEQLAIGDTDNRRDVYERTFDPSVGESGDYVTREVSTGPIGGNAAFDAFFEGQSADGTKVFFSTRERLTSADTDQATDLYVRDLSTGVTSLVSAGAAECAPACGNGGADAGFAGASADGNEVFFVTTESLTPADQDGTVDVYMRDLAGGSTVLVSAGAAECAPSCGSGSYTATLRGISADGSHAFFASAEPLASGDTDTAIDIYSRTLPSGPTELVSAGSPGCAPCGNQGADAIYAGSSADGTKAFFESSEGLVSGDTDGGNDVYERSEGTTSLVSGGTSSAPANIAQENGSGRPAISSDGTKVLFVTAEPLVGGDTNGAVDIYLWSGGSPSLVTSGTCTQGGSCGSTFDAATADLSKLLFTTTERLDPADTDSSADVYETPTAGGPAVLVSIGSSSCAPCGNGAFDAIFNAASANASKVYFTSAESLVAAPGDEDNSNDIYARDLTASTTTLSSPPGECPVPAGCPVVFSGISEDGSHVFFQTEERLTGADNDSEPDIYERAAGQTRLVSQGNSSVLGPSTPILTATNPPSPNPSTTPSILGQSDPNSSVKVYTTGNCSGEPVATGTAAELGGAGIPVTAAPGTSTGFRATATDQNGDTSGCSAPLTYTQGEPPLPPPGEEPPGGETPGGGGTGTGGGTTGSGGGTPPGGKKGGSTNRVGAGPGNNGGTTYVTPRTLITYGPAFKTKKRRPVFLFTDATGQPGTSFFCKLDRRRWHSCGSPLKLSRLGVGKHVLRVKGVNALGIAEEQPVQRKFRVVG